MGNDCSIIPLSFDVDPKWFFREKHRREIELLDAWSFDRLSPLTDIGIDIDENLKMFRLSSIKRVPLYQKHYHWESIKALGFLKISRWYQVLIFNEKFT